ncbi:hypothetical protein CPB84DRAFT_1752361 [Gymnopilus junonius]|uniref:Uncharacterized protein n=1 Tax=Gymnopilus junonius TaxID=109634 RepID=A0A9P5NB96_GYMJU|nr:hypothetical protein CPB84DRAFT_1752361 [Gymnopilus junonius]
METFVGIYGAKRPGHGEYTIKLDNHVFPTLSGASNVSVYNQTLFQTTVPNGQHTITLINAEDATLDVDYVSFEGQVGKQTEPLVPSTFQDNDPAFQYFPRSSWTQSPRPGTFSGSTGTNSQYLVSVDNGPWHTFSARKASVRPHQVLYYGGNLGRGVHTLKLKFAGTNGTTGIFQVDFTNIYSAPSLGAHVGPSIRELEARDLSNVQALQLPSRYIPKSVIAGLSFTSILAFFALGFSLYLLSRQRRSKKEKA